jgi:hypothetical protein
MRKHICFIALALGAVCASSTNAQVAERLTEANVESAKDQKGIVLLAVRWDRRWKCGGYENAQVRVIGFDKLPSKMTSDDDRPDILLDDAPKIFTKPDFDNYAFLVEPGEYGLSGFLIKVARSISDTNYLAFPRSKLIKDSRSLGGSFSVNAGESVYIGNFYLDCYKSPTLWRYHSNGHEAFAEHLKEFKRDFPMLDTTKVKFRLFETTEFGNPYRLP